jgi:hypothetical protein
MNAWDESKNNIELRNNKEQNGMVEPVQIEARTDIVRAQSIEIGAVLGGISISSVADIAKVAELLSRGMVAVPAHCRDQPGVCFALSMQALEWGMPIMSVINKSYVPRGGDRIGYESQLLHAVVEKNAPIKGRLRFEILGEGMERRCKVWATFKGETEPHVYISETLAKLHPGHSTKDNIKYVRGSQLWDTQPEVQMFYSTSRQWARLFCPDVLLGAYAPEELDAPPMTDITPKIEGLAQRLKDAKAAGVQGGFDAEHVAREAAQRSTIIESEANTGDAEHEGAVDGSVNESVVEGRQDDTTDRGDGDRDQGGSGAGGADADAVGGKPAGKEGEDKGQADIFPPDRDSKATKPKPKR